MREKAESDNKPWRVFCAIELPKPTRELVLRHIACLKAAVLDARASWSRDANLHLTLKFLGDVPQASVSDFSKAALRAVAGVQPFSIRLEQTGAFPSHGQPRVLWIGINDLSTKLAELHARLEEESAQAGFAKEARPFHPHLTIARLRKPDNARALVVAHKQMVFDPLDIAVSELVVIKSELGSEGSKYTVVSRHPLGQSPEGSAVSSHTRQGLAIDRERK
ncbi:MAG: RNA 2',3'-cyclic phosphodiesterase [Pyrinomonadaceae bacterium]